jgi:tetratricopeptide (TPR) repeat protein
MIVMAALAAGCSRHASESAAPQTIAVEPATKREPSRPALATEAKSKADAFVGSKTCRDCHADFYKLWSVSWHGLAMQPYTPKFASARLTPQQGDISIGKHTYRVEIGAGAGFVLENGPGGERKLPIVHVMGGKNVYYLLTPMARGRLQVLPLAYDVHKKTWYDMAASGVRHFPDRRDEALDWTDRTFAFNTTCFNCHVTELATNFDLATDSYHTTWAEPGISCESCHGPGMEHIHVMVEAGDMHKIKDIKLIRAKDFTARQTNDMCATCHAKLVPLSLSFRPGDKFFDHFDLITLEHADFYPDGRDLGENYTYTSWLLSPCAKSGKLDCNHCHTPSGRMRFEGEKSNQMCMPCHEKEVRQPEGHGHHKAGSKGNECIACHMPMTRFAAMGRSDHSMRPPTPATTIAFESPNACSMCHMDHDAAWADEWVHKWYKNDYQANVLRQAELIDLARKRQWKRLPEMLAELQKKEGGEVYKASLVRLLHGCDDESKWPVLLGRLQDPSPLVRSSAASALVDHLTPDAIKALLVAAADPSRLVRIRTAMSLAALRPQSLTNERDRANLEKANQDFITAMQARPDDWASHANLGNFYMESRDFPAAASCFETATKLEPRQFGPMVDASMAYSNMDQTDKAEQSLRRALKIEPNSAAANFNLGLLLGERGRLPEAERALRTALKADPQMAAAAFNLGVILGENHLDEAIAWCRKAHELRPTDPKYAHTLAFYKRKKGDIDGAVELLRKAIQDEPSYLDAYLLLGDIYEERRDFPMAAKVYLDASRINQLPPRMRGQLEAKTRMLQSGRSGK